MITKFIGRHLNLIGILMLTTFVAAAAGMYWSGPQKIRSVRARSASAQYTCPMHPNILRDTPGDCPDCGMALVIFNPEISPAENKPAGCCRAKPAAPIASSGCPHLASSTNAAPTGCCPHE